MDVVRNSNKRGQTTRVIMTLLTSGECQGAADNVSTTIHQTTTDKQHNNDDGNHTTQPQQTETETDTETDTDRHRHRHRHKHTHKHISISSAGTVSRGRTGTPGQLVSARSEQFVNQRMGQGPRTLAQRVSLSCAFRERAD